MAEVERLKQEYALLQELCDTQRKLIKSYEEQMKDGAGGAQAASCK